MSYKPRESAGNRRFILFFAGLFFMILFSAGSVCMAQGNENGMICGPEEEYIMFTGTSRTIRVRLDQSLSSRKVIFKSSDPKVVKVKGKGRSCRLTALKKGKATVTCRVKGTNYSLKVLISVKKCRKKVRSLKFKKKTVRLNTGETYNNKLSITPGAAKRDQVEFSSSNPKIVRVDKKGKIYALKSGSSKITVRSIDGSRKKKTYTVIVKDKDDDAGSADPAAGTDSSQSTSGTGSAENTGGSGSSGNTGSDEGGTGSTVHAAVNLYKGEQYKYIFDGTYPGDITQGLSWTSSDSTVAAVASDGMITALDPGTAVVTARSQSGTVLSLNVTAGVLSFENSELRIGKRQVIKNNVKNLFPGDSDRLIWNTGNSEIASVNWEGKVTGKKYGNTIISVSVQGKPSSECSFTLTVYPKINNTDARFIAHRGLSSEAPENTIKAFELAAQAGFWGVETDVWKTKDGHYICLHGPTFASMFGVLKTPEDMTLNEIKRLRAVSGNNLEKYKNDLSATTVPTLEEYLEVCKRYNVVPVIEIKDYYGEMCSGAEDPGLKDMRELYRITQNIMGERQFAFISFFTDSLIRMKQVANEHNNNNVIFQYLCLLYTDRIFQVCEQYGFDFSVLLGDAPGEQYGFDFSPVRYMYLSDVAEDITNIHNSGLKAGAWTVDKKEDAAEIIAAGFDYITTNIRLFE